MDSKDIGKREVFMVGSRVVVSGHGPGMIEMDNEDGTWNVELDNGDDCDVSAEDLTLCEDQSLDDLRSHLHGWPRTMPSGIQIVDPFALPEKKPQGWTRIVCFSDTHGLHNMIPNANMPVADILLHAGDFTNSGELDQIKSFNLWLRDYPATQKVVIAGNHDTTLDMEYYEDRGGKRFHKEPYDCTKARGLLTNCIYLENETAEVGGYTVYGSPYSPAFCDWAFNLERGTECYQAWQSIPDYVDILMTHGPPKGHGDQADGKRVGCADLRTAVEERTIPLHVFGHIHNSWGCSMDDSTLYVNASTCTSEYSPVNPPIVLDVPPPAELHAVMQPEENVDVTGDAFFV